MFSIPSGPSTSWVRMQANRFPSGQMSSTGSSLCAGLPQLGSELVVAPLKQDPLHRPGREHTSSLTARVDSAHL